MSASQFLADAGAVLLDFDGPVCSIFAGYPASEIAEHLRQVMRANGGTTEGSVLAETDPLKVLEFVAEHDERLLDRIEEALCTAEMKAAETAKPTPDADRLMEQVARMGIPLVVVSNNSAPAIELYLRHHDLMDFALGIVGRSFARPDRMKPNPWPILQAAELAGVPAEVCILIGDSETDVTAALAAGAQCIGVANRPVKQRTLPAAGAIVTVTSVGELLGNPAN